MNLTVNHVFIAVTDQDRALEFYTGVLGLKLKEDAPLGPYRWLTVVSPSNPNLEIVLERPDMGRSPEDAAALADLIAKGASGAVIFATDDVDAAFEEIRASGAEIVQEPIDQPYGVRDCAFRDPFGNHLRLSQVPMG